MDIKTSAFLACLTLACSALAWPPDYNPSWQVDDTWQVEVTYQLRYPNWVAIATSTNLESEAYPYPAFFTSQGTNATYSYRVSSVSHSYQYKPPLYDPFVSRPGSPNAESNSATAVVVDIQAPTNLVGLLTFS